MRINLRKINQLIREAWHKGQAAAVSGRGGKSSCYSWSTQVARDYFLDIRPEDVARIAKGQARLHWDAEKREVVVETTKAGAPEEKDAAYRTVSVFTGIARDPLTDASPPPPICIGDVIRPGRRYRVTIEEASAEEVPTEKAP